MNTIRVVSTIIPIENPTNSKNGAYKLEHQVYVEGSQEPTPLNKLTLNQRTAYNTIEEFHKDLSRFCESQITTQTTYKPKPEPKQ